MRRYKLPQPVDTKDVFTRLALHSLEIGDRKPRWNDKETQKARDRMSKFQTRKCKISSSDMHSIGMTTAMSKRSGCRRKKSKKIICRWCLSLWLKKIGGGCCGLAGKRPRTNNTSTLNSQSQPQPQLAQIVRPSTWDLRYYGYEWYYGFNLSHRL